MSVVVRQSQDVLSECVLVCVCVCALIQKLKKKGGAGVVFGWSTVRRTDYEKPGTGNFSRAAQYEENRTNILPAGTVSYSYQVLRVPAGSLYDNIYKSYQLKS
jgi:hypothetical protein